MSNSQEDLLIFYNLALPGMPLLPSQIKPIFWNPPLPTQIKVNIDDLACSIWVFRTYRGFVEGYFSCPAGICFAFEAEPLALITAIELALSFNLKKLWVESDSIYVIGAFESKTSSVPWKLRNRWLNALNLCKARTVSISHIFREGNVTRDN